MKRSGTNLWLARSLERANERAANRVDRPTRWRNRGQTLIIFVLLFTALIGFMGLAIDAARVYDLYARMQRAAESGALAGVIYMPNNYDTNIPQSPFDDAICRALQETSKNGFGTFCNPGSSPGGAAGLCPTPPSSIEIAVCPVVGFPHDLQVYITESISVSFLSALGVGSLTLTAVARAQYIPPVDVAVDPSATGGTGGWGTFGECNGASSACTGSGTRNWSGNINGPGELKEQGDPLVTCEEGPSGLNPGYQYGTIDTNAASSKPYTTFVGKPSNHPQQYTTPLGVVPTQCVVPTNPSQAAEAAANPDNANVFTGPAYYNPSGSAPLHTGYGFYVHVPSGATENLWVWNAPFSPSSLSSCNGRAGGNNQKSYDVFYYYNCGGSSSSPYPYYPGTSCATIAAAPYNSPYTCPDAKLFFSVTYSIYTVPDPSSPTAGNTLLATFTAMPYEVNDHGCNYWQPTSNETPYTASMSAGCASSSNCVVNWCPVADHLGDVGALWSGYNLTGGDYRVMVVASDYGDPDNYNVGYGGHSYSLKLCPAGTTQGNVQTCTPASGSTVAGWTLSDALFSFPGNGSGNAQVTEYPLGVVGPEYAGEILDVQLFDQGDLNGTNSSAKGYTVYAVAPPTAAGANGGDPCSVTTAQLNAAGYTSSSFAFPYNERTTSFSNALTGVEGSNKGDLIYNGLWTDIQITVPSTYTVGAWTLCAIAPQTNDGDVIGIKVNAIGASPVHLV
jgi:hypothetical protein